VQQKQTRKTEKLIETITKTTNNKPFTMPSPMMAAVTHSAAFCIGAAAVSLLLHHSSSPPPSTISNVSIKDSTTDDSADVIIFSKKETKSIPTSHSEHFNNLLPTLPIRLFQPNDNLLIAFDTRNKNPTFVMERMIPKQRKVAAATAADEEPPSRKNKRFFEEKTIPAHHRSRNHHYRNSGYDRGHLAPAADFNTDSEVHDSFSLSNVSPQLPRFNRTMWLRVEEFVRSVVVVEQHEQKDKDDLSELETYVLTGPLWLPASNVGKDKFQYSYEAIGHPPSLIHIPTHFFKVIVVVSPIVDNSGPRFQLKKFAAFVIPHSESDEKSSRLRLVDCIVRLTDLEAVVGLEFFPNLLGSHADGSDDDDTVPLYKELADALTDDVRVHAKNNQLLLLEDGSNTEHDENGSALPQSGVGLSKRRQKKIKQLLRDNNPPLFQHLCKTNKACFKYL
jgi:endonuclease G